ncbi:MAG: phosphatidylserine decarboxylase family protein [Bacteroidetes bacterium]|nr:phosphatidylserine decarboxylase family protein [Bacteroidota bacterium]
MIAREGWPLIMVAFLIGLMVCLLILIIPGIAQWMKLIMIPMVVPGFPLSVMYFFRDPEREIPLEAESIIIAPADGKIVEIVQEQESNFVDGKVWRISIFLSVLDVHVNRVPVSGTVRHLDYKSGTFKVAWHPDASAINEQSIIGIEHPSGKRVLFKQIAGTLARRIVNRLSKGDIVDAGKRFGLIRFGSRMDVIFSMDIHPQVEIGDRVRAGETILGVIPLDEHT